MKRELITRLIAGQAVARCGFWLGQPHPDTWPHLHRHFGTSSESELRHKLQDDVLWRCPQFDPGAYLAPDGRQMFNLARDPAACAKHPLADCQRVADLASFVWPNPDYLNFDACLQDLRAAGDVYRLSGYWTCFYHDIADLFGMEEFFVKMFTHPQVVQAATDRICEFYYEANERFFRAAGDLVDGSFFGNDFGTQLGLMCGPAQFDAFILPWFRRFTAQGHRHGHQVVVHSCGSIHAVIGRLIDAGVNCLHPLQAKAANMDADTLARDFKGKIVFLGGIDAQELLPHGTPEQVKADVERVRARLGPNLIISPSHEAILPDVPPANVAALAEAATGVRWRAS